MEELGVEGLSVESWLLDADFFGDGVGRAYGWKGVLSIVRSLRCKRCDSLPSSELVSRGATTEAAISDSTDRLIVWLSLMLSFLLGSASGIKSMLDWRYNVLLRLMRLDGFRTERGSSSSPDSSAIPAIGVLSLARHRASSTILARVPRWEWGQSTGPLASATPRAILSNRLEGGTGPLNGVSRWDGNASKVCLTRGEREKEIRKWGKDTRSGKGIAYSLKHPDVFWLPFCCEIVFVDGTVPAV